MAAIDMKTENGREWDSKTRNSIRSPDPALISLETIEGEISISFTKTASRFRATPRDGPSRGNRLKQVALIAFRENLGKESTNSLKPTHGRLN